MNDTITVSTEKVEFIRLGFSSNWALQFIAEFTDVDELAAAVSTAGQYNEFDPARIVPGLRDLAPATACVSFGRDSSPVLVFEVPSWTHMAIAAGPNAPRGERLADQYRHDLIARIAAWGERVGADEVEVIDPGRKIRLWWD